MWGLIRFFRRYANVFLYFVLLGISLILLAGSRAEAGSKLNRWTFNGLNVWAQQLNVIQQFFYLPEANQRLLEENRQLYERLYNRREHYDLPPDFSFVPATIVNRNYRSGFDFIILDKGRIDGVGMRNGVFSADGVVGTVQRVSAHFARVITLQNPRFTVLVRLKQNPAVTGFTVASPVNYPLVGITGIPYEATLKTGDTLETAGNSLIFPPGIPVGKVMSAVRNESKRTQTVWLKPFADLRRLKYVYIVHHKLQNELDSLGYAP